MLISGQQFFVLARKSTDKRLDWGYYFLGLEWEYSHGNILENILGKILNLSDPVKFGNILLKINTKFFKGIHFLLCTWANLSWNMLVNTFRNIWNHILYIIYASVAPGEYYQNITKLKRIFSVIFWEYSHRKEYFRKYSNPSFEKI